MNDLRRAYHAGQFIGLIVVIGLLFFCGCTIMSNVK